MSGRTAAAPERRIRLAGQDNFRDLGGYETTDRRRVRWRRVFRSGDLCTLSQADLALLSELGIRQVVDLRGVDEAERKGPGRLPAGALRRALPIEPGELAELLWPALASGDFSSVPEGLFADISRDYVRGWKHRLAALLRIASDPESSPLVFHCTQGKDRTGIASAVLLSALGVPWETVMDDYLISNVHRLEQSEAQLDSLRRSAASKRGLPPEAVDVTPIRGLFFVHASYLEAARAEVTGRHGSFEGFVVDGLGCSESELQRLRDTLLE